MNMKPLTEEAVEPSSLPAGTKLSAFYGRFHAVVGVNLTNKCNFSCSHCGVSSGPRETSKLEYQAVIRELQRHDPLRYLKGVHVSGGEPFLYLQALKEIGAATAAAGLYYAVNTNGFWAKSPDKAEEILGGIEGLTQINLSFDRYHQPYIEFERIRYAASACRNRSIVCQIAVCTPNGTSDEFVEDVRTWLTEESYDDISLLVFPTEPYGRGSQLREAAMQPMGRDSEEPCGFLNRPVVMEDGSVQACCNTAVGKDFPSSSLKLGNIHSTTLAACRDKASSSDLIQAIRVWGPQRVAELAGLRLNDERAGACATCTAVVTNSEAARNVERALGERDLAMSLSIDRAALYDEWDLLIPREKDAENESAARNCADDGIV